MLVYTKTVVIEIVYSLILRVPTETKYIIRLLLNKKFGGYLFEHKKVSQAKYQVKRVCKEGHQNFCKLRTEKRL